ncbi:MAG: preprotein translocase subunit SecG [Bacteroidota bacterium]
MITFLTILIALLSIPLMTAVLIQNPKGGGIDSSFGGSSANQMLGATKSNVLIEKLIWGLGITLFLLCILTAVAV